MQLEDKDFIALRDFMHENYGIDLEKKRSLIESRLSLTVSQKGFKDFGGYISNLVKDTTGSEAAHVVSKLTTNYTYFMREDAHYKYLVDAVLPQMMPKIHDHDFRIWSAGCSSGEEAYTTAMVLDNYLGASKSAWDTVILATDISANVLEKAKLGCYTDDKMMNLSDAWKKKYFTVMPDGQYALTPQIKREVVFKNYNLMEKKFSFKKPFHVIFCRNVMIYFDIRTRKELVNRFYDSLMPGGYLFTGMAESIVSLGTKFTYIKPAIYRKQ